MTESGGSTRQRPSPSIRGAHPDGRLATRLGGSPAPAPGGQRRGLPTSRSRPQPDQDSQTISRPNPINKKKKRGTASLSCRYLICPSRFGTGRKSYLGRAKKRVKQMTSAGLASRAAPEDIRTASDLPLVRAAQERDRQARQRLQEGSLSRRPPRHEGPRYYRRPPNA
jgi:hypothetical protein